MATTADPPNDLELLELLLANPTLTASEVARAAGLAVPPAATDDEPTDGDVNG